MWYKTCILAAVFFTLLCGDTLETIEYSESSEEIPNPERGWHRYRNYDDLWGLDLLRPRNETLIYGRVYVPHYRDREFPEVFLTDTLQNLFDQARSHGLKVNFRLTYSAQEDEPDAPLEMVLRHIEQLSPLLHDNADVLNVMAGGFVGAWGEWHGSAHNLTDPENRKVILDAILASLPEDRMFLMRYPMYKRDHTDSDITKSHTWLQKDEAFTNRPIARIGHLNDCFVSSETDVGTYHQNGREAELAYLSREAPYLAWGGETCRVHEYNNCERTLREINNLGANYLNRDYNRDVLDVWKDEGCFQEISRRLGYRFVLHRARIQLRGEAGNHFKTELEIENTGFGNLFNPRPVEAVLIDPETKQRWTAPLSEDPRFWQSGDTHRVQFHLSLPADLPRQNYILGIALPDAAQSLRGDPRYSIRFANRHIWDSTENIHVLTRDFTVEKPDDSTPEYTAFEEVFPQDTTHIHQNAKHLSRPEITMQENGALRMELSRSREETLLLSVRSPAGRSIFSERTKIVPGRNVLHLQLPRSFPGRGVYILEAEGKYTHFSIPFTY